MSCSMHNAALPKGAEVRVNGARISRDAISREAQFHPSKSPLAAWTEAAQALVVRELLLQEARRLGLEAAPAVDAEGRKETDADALIRALFEREAATPEPDPATCRRYYEQNRQRFRSPDIYEAAHILFAAVKTDAAGYAQAKDAAETAIALLREQPGRFAELAQAHSACPSGAQGGNLGQITAGQTTPEFEQALSRLAPGAMTQEPVATRYGFHIIRLDRRHDGAALPFELVAGRIADYLRESVRRRAAAQYIARLAGAAQIEGIEMKSAEALRTH
jgi:peptidyl-prolyl cis-trans isomerase C